MKNFKDQFQLPDISSTYLKKIFPTKDNFIWLSSDRESIAYKLKNNILLDQNELDSFHSQFLSLLFEVKKSPKLIIWQELNEHLNHMIALHPVIVKDKEVVTELKCLQKYLLDNPEFSYLLPGLELKLKLILPKSISVNNKIRKSEDNEESLPLLINSNYKIPSTKIMPENVIEWFIDPVKGNLFNPNTIDKNITVKPKRIKIKDFLFAFGSVAEEIILNQYSFEKPLQNLVKALNLDLSKFGENSLSKVDEACQEMEDNNVENTVVTEQETKNPEKVKSLSKPKFGRDVAVYMIKCFHLCEMRVAYLNYTKRRIRDVYDLTLVPKQLLEPEHFIFSSFGIIHRFSDGTGIAMSLTDWYRESILYYSMRCIPFVKNFLVKKYFQGWYSLTIKNKHLSIAKYLSRNLIPANVTFGKSILQILRLLDEISHVKFVPDHFLETQTESSFLKNISIINKTADSYLETFYRYIKLMANETAAELYKLLQFSQAQLHNIYLYSNDSIYLKRIKKEKREQCLKDSLYQVQKLGNFIKLINYMLNNKIVEITLNNIVILGELVCSLELDYMTSNNVSKEAIFKTNIIITKLNDQTSLCASPGVKEMQSILFDVIDGIPKLILKHCYPLDGILRTEYLMRYEKILSEHQNEGKLHKFNVLSSNSEIKSLISKQTPNIGEQFLSPEFPFIELPKKSEDGLRVATPPKVNTNIFNNPSCKLVGQAIPSNFTPLTTSDVFAILELNPLYNSLTAGFVDLFSESAEEINDICSQSLWLLDVRKEYDEWLKIDMSITWVNGTSSMFEQKLMKIRNYIQALESTKRIVVLSNKLFLVDFESVLEELLSEMNFEWESVSNFIFNSAKTKGMEFIEKIQNILEILHMRTRDVESLSKMADSITLCKENNNEFENSVNYIKSLFEVLRIVGKETMDNTEYEMITLWESLKIKLQEASEFLNDEKANVLGEITLRIKNLEDEAILIERTITSSKYSQLSNDNQDILIEIDNMQDKIDQIQMEINILSKSYRSLDEEECPTSVDINKIKTLVCLTNSSWKLLKTIISQIEQWKMSLFSQFNVSEASSIISEYQEQLAKLQFEFYYIGEINQNIEEHLNEFLAFFPLFRQLSSSMFSLYHWEQFFNEIGHAFVDPYNELTVQTLIDLDIISFSRVIDLLFNDALMKSNANKEFEHHLRFWLTREFDFIEHTADIYYKKRYEEKMGRISKLKTPVLEQKRSELEMYHNNKIMEKHIERLSRLPIVNNLDRKIFLVSQFNRLYEDITDSIISIQLRKQKDDRSHPYISLVSTLHELRYNVEIISECQEKWLFLERVFEEEFFVQAHMESATQFLTVNEDFISILEEFKQFPIIFYHLSSNDLALPETNTKELNSLSRLKPLIEMMNTIISDIKKILINSRNLFPRLYFLPDYELIRLLSCNVSQNIQNINSFVHFCFPAVKNVIFTRDLNHSNQNKAFSITSTFGESLELFKPLKATNMVCQWLKDFELILKSTLKFYIDSCISRQLTEINLYEDKTFITEDRTLTMFDEMEELTNRMPENNQNKVVEIVNDILLNYEAWLMKYPLQALLISEKINFNIQLKEALSNRKNNLVHLRSHLMGKKNNFVHLIKKHWSSKSCGTKFALENLLILNDHHMEIIENFVENTDQNFESFYYKSLIKYDINDAEMIKLSMISPQHLDKIRVECFHYKFQYDYEYINMKGKNLISTEVSDKTKIHLLMSLNNLEIGTIIGKEEKKYKTMKSISKILGRNYFVVPCQLNFDGKVLQKYMIGALLSGSLLYLEKINEMSMTLLSNLSKELMKIRDHFLSKSLNIIFNEIDRPSSSPCRSFQDQHIVENDGNNWSPDSERSYHSSNQDNMDNSGYYELQNTKLDKGTYMPFTGLENRHMYSSYTPNYIFQTSINEATINVRYGFGICAEIMNCFDFQPLPLSLKSQMRAHFLVDIDGKFLIKQYLILSKQNENLEELESLILQMLESVNKYLPHMLRGIKKLLPSVIFHTDWSIGKPIYALRNSLLLKIASRISNEFNDQDIFKKIVNDIFPFDISENDLRDIGLRHQIKCQIRSRNRDEFDVDYTDKVMELKTCINSHQIIILTGPDYSGKTSMVDILAQAINNSFGSSRSPRQDSKNRGHINVLKSLSDERKLQGEQDNICENDNHKNIVHQRITLANFSPKEFGDPRIIKETENPAILSTIIKQLVKASSIKYQVWLCVETNENRLETDLCLIQSELSSFSEENVKIIFEVQPLIENRLLELSLSYGIVQFPRINNLIDIILEQKIKYLLMNKIISYYGSKFLTNLTKAMFSNLFESLQIEIEILKKFELDVNCVIQSLEILELIFLSSQKDFTDFQENLGDLENRYKTFLCFSIIQGVRGSLYSVLMGKGLLNNDEFENILKPLLSSHCEICLESTDEEIIFSVFGLMIDFSTMVLKKFHTIKGCQLPMFWSCADGVANYVIQLSIKFGKSLFINSQTGRLESFVKSIRYNKKMSVNNESTLKMLRRILYEKNNEYWNILSNHDHLSTKHLDKDVILLENFVTDSKLSEVMKSLIQFSLEHKFIFDSSISDSDEKSFNRVILKHLTLIFANQSKLNSLNFHHLKIARWFIVISVIDPCLTESKVILYKSIHPWLSKAPSESLEFSLQFTMKIADFVIGVATEIGKQQKTPTVVNSSNSEFTGNVDCLVKWSQIIELIKSFVSLPLELFVNIFQRFESQIPVEFQSNIEEIEKYDILNNYPRLSVRIRILRYLVFVTSRVFIDPLKDENKRSIVNSIIVHNLENHFFRITSFEINNAIVKNFLNPEENLADIIMIPTRFCSDFMEECNPYYQPVVDAYSVKLLEIANENILKTDTVANHLSKSVHLIACFKSETFMKYLMKMYKHISKYSVVKSSFVVEYSSCSLIAAVDLGCFLSTLIQAIYVPFETSSGKKSIDEFHDTLLFAMARAAKGQQKVLFHLDSALVHFQTEMCERLIQIVQDDSIASLLQFLQTDFIHKTIKENYNDLFIQSGSAKEKILSKVFLENIHRNLKILITINKSDMDRNRNVKNISQWFLTRSYEYMVMDYNYLDIYKASFDHLIDPSLPRSDHCDMYKILADCHKYFCDYFDKYFKHFGVAFFVSVHHLQMARSLYDFLFDFCAAIKDGQIKKLQSVVNVVNKAKDEIENLKSQKCQLHEDLKTLNDELVHSADEIKCLRDTYGLMLIECKNQEKLVDKLTGPLNELKEKSKSNLDDISPTYTAAVEMVRNLDIDAIDEIKTYIKPPQPVQDLVVVIFYLLGYDTNWEEIKEIMVKINLYEELLYFDKNNMEEKKYKYLREALQNPMFQKEYLVDISQAAASLSGWLLALFTYTSLNRKINPQLGEMMFVQDKVNKAQSELGKMKVRADNMLQNLEAKLENYKDLVSKKKFIRALITEISYKIDSGTILLDDLNIHFNDWMDQLVKFDQERKDLSLNIVGFVINNVYLSRLPFKIRKKISLLFQNSCSLKIEGSCEIFDDQNVRKLFEHRLLHSVNKIHIENAIQMAITICCPKIIFPDLGSIVFIHCHNDCSADSIKIIKIILESPIIERFRNQVYDTSVIDKVSQMVQIFDCSRNDNKYLNGLLKNAMQIGIILIIEKVELLTELCSYLKLLLYGKTNQIDIKIHSDFRLIFISEEIYSSTDKIYGIFSSTRLIHYDFSVDYADIQDYLLMVIVERSQPKLFKNFKEYERQLYEIKSLCNEEKESIRMSVIFSTSGQKQSESENLSDSSLLDVRNFHADLLKTESNIFGLNESYDTMNKEYREILKSFDRYNVIVEPIRLLLYNFGLFTLDKICNRNENDFSSGTKRFVSLKETLDVIKIKITEEIKAVTMMENVEPEISEQFLQKVKYSLISSIIGCLNSKMDVDEIRKCVLEFCVDMISNEENDFKNVDNNDVNFIKFALFCKSPEDLLLEHSEESLKFIQDQTNEKIPKKVIHTALMIETNVTSLNGLSQSLVDNNDLWCEYFKFPFINPTRMPGFDFENQPGLLQKSVVWLLLNPIKTNEIFSSLIIHVFGEDIFRYTSNIIEKLQESISTCSQTQPIILSTRKNILDCTINPCELVKMCHKKLQKSSEIMFIDCANHLNLNNVLSVANANIETEESQSFSQFMKKPLWLIFFNAHLYDCIKCDTDDSLHLFFHHIFKNLLINMSNQSVNKVDPEFRMFITLEKTDSFQYPDVVLNNSIVVQCRPSSDFEKRCNECVFGMEENITTTVLSTFYAGIFQDSLYKMDICSTTQDLTEIVEIAALVPKDCSNVIQIVRLIYENKILIGEKVTIFNSLLKSIYPVVEDFISRKTPQHVFHKNTRHLVDQLRFQHSFSQDHLLKKKEPRELIFLHNQLADLPKSKLITVSHQLMQTISLLHQNSSINYISLIKKNKKILHRIFCLSILIGSFKSDSVSYWNEIEDLYHLINEKLFCKTYEENTISKWLENIVKFVNDVNRCISTADDESLTKVTTDMNCL